MPAIQPVRLKKQVTDLAGKINQPALFIRDLHALLDLYTDHTHRAGQSGEPTPLIASYKAPPPVMRQVWNEVKPMIKGQSAEVLALCDALWAERNFDLHLLAARLLGELPLTPPDPVIDRLNSWVSQVSEDRVLDGLFEHGLMRLLHDSPERVLELVSAWMNSSDLLTQKAGLRALLSIINQFGSETIPSIFRMLTPYMRIAPSRLRPDILAVISALAHISPPETAYLLRQNLSAPENPDTAWLIRQVLNDFPKEVQGGLRDALKEKRSEAD
jgi:hypothetical protein